jgi:hypothetical protein
MPGRHSILFIESPAAFAREPAPPLGPAGAAFLRRMNGAAVGVVLLVRPDDQAQPRIHAALAGAGIAIAASGSAPAWSAKLLLAIARDAQADLSASWLVCAETAAIPAAETAGLAGVILIGADPPPGEHALVVARAADLGDVPRVLIPRGGGCWHDRS